MNHLLWLLQMEPGEWWHHPSEYHCLHWVECLALVRNQGDVSGKMGKWLSRGENENEVRIKKHTWHFCLVPGFYMLAVCGNVLSCKFRPMQDPRAAWGWDLGTMHGSWGMRLAPRAQRLCFVILVTIVGEGENYDDLLFQCYLSPQVSANMR